jgi:hypothetical protein
MKRKTRYPKKRCPKCKKTKPLTSKHFTLCKTRWKSWCIPCSNGHKRELYKTDEYRQKNNERNEIAKRKEELFGFKLERQYGITLRDYKRMWVRQRGRCPVCKLKLIIPKRAIGKTAKRPGNRTACVHHDHPSGKVVGIGCKGCNRGFGFLKDSPILARRAAKLHEKALA